MDPEINMLNLIFPTKYVIPKSLKFSHWPSKIGCSLTPDGNRTWWISMTGKKTHEKNNSLAILW